MRTDMGTSGADIRRDCIPKCVVGHRQPHLLALLRLKAPGAFREIRSERSVEVVRPRERPGSVKECRNFWRVVLPREMKNVVACSPQNIHESLVALGLLRTRWDLPSRFQREETIDHQIRQFKLVPALNVGVKCTDPR